MIGFHCLGGPGFCSRSVTGRGVKMFPHAEKVFASCLQISFHRRIIKSTAEQLIITTSFLSPERIESPVISVFYMSRILPSRILHVPYFTCPVFYMSRILHVPYFTCSVFYRPVNATTISWPEGGRINGVPIRSYDHFKRAIKTYLFKKAFACYS